MCYSAQVRANYRDYVRRFGADISLEEFAKLYGFGKSGPRKTPKALDESFADGTTPEEQKIWNAIVQQRRENVRSWQTALFAQRKRLADAERAIASGKVTKKATEDVRIAGNKIKQLKRWLEDAERTEPAPGDSRIYPGVYAPVMIWEDGRRIVKPMRFQCRMQGWTAAVERKYPGTYNARRDSLDKSWGKHWGSKHAVIVIDAFYEHVWRHQAEGRALRDGEAEEDVVIEFRPNVGGEMLLACLWSDWGDGPDDKMLSFAFITDDPPPEVQAAGHDRCVIPIKPQYVDAWLQPNGDTEAMQRILDDRERPYYEHKLAA